MNNKIILLASLLLALVSFTNQSHAEGDSGFYVAAGVGTTGYYDDDKFKSYDLDDTDMGWTVFGGYRLMRYLAIEGGYTNFGKFSAERGNFKTDEEFAAVYLAAVGILPLGESWQLRGKLGGGSIQLDQSFSDRSSSDDNGGTVLLGVGAQWAPASLNGLAFNLNVDAYMFTVEQLDEDYNQSTALFSLGVQYNF